jgi:hypothetical protein
MLCRAKTSGGCDDGSRADWGEDVIHWSLELAFEGLALSDEDGTYVWDSAPRSHYDRHREVPQSRRI